MSGNRGAGERGPRESGADVLRSATPGFGEIVRTHRLRLGLSREALAERSGVGVRSIAKIESGRTTAPRPVTVRSLADAFGLTGAARDEFCRAVPDGPAAEPVRPTGVTPAQLPADVLAFAGRVEPLARLDSLLDAGAPAQTVVISAVCGTAGVGKTALAVHWAHRVRGRFPDGQLHVNLRGFDPDGQVMAPTVALRHLLDALGVPPERIPHEPDARSAMYRSLLAGRRMLIVLDNARDAEQVRPLLPGTPSCLVLVTSRNQLASLVAVDGACPLPLDLLTPAEARELLACRLGSARIAAEPRAVDEIVTSCSRLPLALAIAAARVQQTGFRLAAVAADLSEARDRLDVLDAGDPMTEVRTVLSWSYRALTPPAARLFRLLGTHPGPDIAAAAAASLAGLPLAPVRRQLTELVQASLLTEQAPGRYGLHDLLRVYATEVAHAVDPQAERRAATTRLLDHYVHTAHTAALLMGPTRDPVPLPLPVPAEGVRPERLAGQRPATSWLAAEYPVLIRAVEEAADGGLAGHAWQLAWALDTFLDRQGHWHDRAAVWRTAVRCAERIGHQPALALALELGGAAGVRLGDFTDARADLERSLDLHARLDNTVGQASVHHHLAMLCERQGDPAQALDHALRSLAGCRAAGHLRGQAGVLNSVGWCHVLLGNHAQAVPYCEQALELFQRLGERAGEAHTWDSLGYAHHHLGHHAEAAACYQRSVELFRDLGDRFFEAIIRIHLGDTHRAAGDPRRAGTEWRRALSTLAELDRPEADGVRARLDDLGRSQQPADGERPAGATPSGRRG